MSASDPSPLTSNLQESIEQLVAETVRRSQMDHDEETKRLRTALETALSEVEAGQASMTRAASILRTALSAASPAPATQEPESETPVDEIVAESPAPVDEPKVAPATTEEPGEEPEVEPHGMDVVAHNVNFKIASGLQGWLKERPEVTDVRTRTFVNGELHLDVQMASRLDMTQLSTWIAGHDGRVKTTTPTVLELSFGD